MTRKNIILTWGFVLLTAACGKVKGMGGDAAGSLDSNQLQKATEQFCSGNQTLQVLENGTDVPFGQLNFRTRIFAFIDKDATKECIIKDAVTMPVQQDGTWFTINPLDNCLKNGSIWVVNSTPSGMNQYYTMTRVDDPSLRIMNMNGDQRVRGSLLSENLGLKLLTCINK